jgi:hypothetical protein
VALSTSADADSTPRLAVGRDCQSIVVSWLSGPHGLNGTVQLQRLDMAGVPQYVQDGIAITGGPNEIPNFNSVVASDNGSCVVAWSMQGSQPVRTQKFDAAGNAMWGPTPIEVSNTSDVAQLLSDGAGGAVYGWSAYIGNGWRTFIQRLDSTGAETLPHGGLPVSLRAVNQFVSSIALCRDPATSSSYSWRGVRPLAALPSNASRRLELGSGARRASSSLRSTTCATSIRRP